MRFYHKLALMALLSGSAIAGAQPQRPPVSADQDVDDDEAPPQARANDGMPPPDPRAYPQNQPPPQQYQEAAQQYGYMGPHPLPYEVGQGFCYEGGAHFHEYHRSINFCFPNRGDGS